METENIIKEDFSKEEKLKLENYQKQKLIINFIYIISIVIWIIYLIAATKLKLVFTIVILAIILVSYLYTKSSQKEINNYLKTKVLNRVLKDKYTKVLYDLHGCINSNIFKYSQISLQFDKYNGSNFILIPKDGYNIEICKVNTISNNLNNYNGIFGRIVLPNELDNQIAVIKDNLIFDNDIYKLEKNTNQIIGLIPNLESEYNIFATTKENISSFFDAELCNCIFNINKNIGRKIQFSIYKSILYFRIDNIDFMNIKFNNLEVDFNTINYNTNIIDLIIDFSKNIVDKCNQE